MTILSLSSDKTDYSKYDPASNVVTVRGTVDAGSSGASFPLSLSRKDIYGVVATNTVICNGTNFMTTFDLNSAGMNDANGVNRVNQGDYLVIGTQGGSTVSYPFTVSVVSVSEMYAHWMYGATLYAAEIALPKQQPTGLPVWFTEVSPFFLKNPYVLTYTAGNPATISFAGGVASSIPAHAGIVELVLLDQRQSDWVKVKIDTEQLPATNWTNTIVIDQAKMSDSDVVSHIRQATSWLENQLGFWVEPHLVVSPHLQSKYPLAERVMQGAGFYGTFSNWDVFPNISLPFSQLLEILDLEGWLNQTSVVTVPSQWIQRNEQAGNIELIPSNNAPLQLIWSGIGAAYTYSNFLNIPEFWQYAAVAGLRDMNLDRAIIREAIAKKATNELLVQAGIAYRAGISSRSTSRDAVSFSESYTSSAMYGPFAHITMPNEDWLAKNVPQIRRRIGGFTMTTLM